METRLNNSLHQGKNILNGVCQQCTKSQNRLSRSLATMKLTLESPELYKQHYNKNKKTHKDKVFLPAYKWAMLYYSFLNVEVMIYL